MLKNTEFLFYPEIKNILSVDFVHGTLRPYSHDKIGHLKNMLSSRLHSQHLDQKIAIQFDKPTHLKSETTSLQKKLKKSLLTQML